MIELFLHFLNLLVIAFSIFLLSLLTLAALWGFAVGGMVVMALWAIIKSFRVFNPAN